MTLNGIDVSSNQGAINWAQVAQSGVQFAFVKLSEGVGYVNPQAATDLSACRANGILAAVYHFALPAQNSPQDEAAHFIAAFGDLAQPFDVIALDIEEDPYGGAIPTDCGSWALAWLDAVQAAFRCKPLVYSNLDLIVNHNLGVLASHDYGIWLADPGDANPSPPAPWTILALQQTSWTAHIPGISGGVDQDVFFGDETAWKRYGLPAAPPPPPDPCAALRAQVADLTGQRDAAYARITSGLSLLQSATAALQGVTVTLGSGTGVSQ